MSGKFMVKDFDVRNNFANWNFLQFSTNLEIKFRFLPGFEFKGGWLLRKFVLTNTNSPLHKLGQGLLQDDL
jgi:hypothetical protein